MIEPIDGRPRVASGFMQNSINRTPVGIPKVGLGQPTPTDGEVIRIVKGGFYGRGYSVYCTKFQGGEVVSESTLEASLTKVPCQRVFDAL